MGATTAGVYHFSAGDSRAGLSPETAVRVSLAADGICWPLMARAEPRAFFHVRDVRPGDIWDGVPEALSYLFFTALEQRAPTVSRMATLVAERMRGRSWLAGTAETPEGTVRIAHLGPPDRFARWFLDRLGAKEIRAVPASAEPGSVPCAVEIMTIPANRARAFGHAGWLVLPRYVHHRQRLTSTPSGYERRVAERALANRLTFRFTQRASDLEAFRRQLYEPMLQRRHGANALRTGRALLSLGQRRGGLFLVEADGQAVSGAIGAPSVASPRDLEIWALGVAREAPSGSDLAPVLAWIGWAREQGYDAVDHLVTVPLFSDGLTRHKLRWGTALLEPRGERDVLAIRTHGSTRALSSWLGRHSFAARTRTGIVRVDVSNTDELAKRARALSTA